MREGWFPAYKRMYDSDHWLAPTARDPSCRRDAWSDLLSMATYQPRETKDSGTLERGELVASLRSLAKRWKWHRSRVERFINELEVRTAIGTVRETPDGTVYRIVNYESYAVGENVERDTERDKNRDSGETAARQEVEVKKKRTKNTTSAVRWKRCPAEWAGPNDSHRALAKELGVDLGFQELKFRNYNFPKPHSDADATFSNWIVNAASKWSSNGNGKSQKGPQRAPYVPPTSGFIS